jgi:hypothetical protein
VVITLSAIAAALRQRAPRRKNAHATMADHREATLSQFCHDYVDVGMPGLIYCIRRPGTCLTAFVALYRMLPLRADPSGTLEGAAIRKTLSEGSVIRRTMFPARAVLTLPRHPGQYDLGGSKKTLRYYARRAQRRGVHWAKVDDQEERQKLAQVAAEWERVHPVEYYRNPDPDIGSLLNYGLWLAAYSADGQPLLLSVTPVDGQWALLRYFRTMTTGEDASNARYLMTQVLVEHLVSLGARYLIDQASPLWLSNGLRHYQRILGFRLVRLHLVPQGRSWLHWRGSPG